MIATPDERVWMIGGREDSENLKAYIVQRKGNLRMNHMLQSNQPLRY